MGTQNRTNGDERRTREVSTSATLSVFDDVCLISGLTAPCVIGLPPKVPTPWFGPTGNRLGDGPAASLGEEHDIEDADGSGGVFAITIVPPDALVNGAASFVLPVNARAKVTFSPKLGAWTAQLYEPGGGGGVLAGDVTGPLGANIVGRINGATVPVAGALTPGNVLQVSGASTLAYVALPQVPTGTGFAHVTGGVLDVPSKQVDLSTTDVVNPSCANNSPWATNGEITIANADTSHNETAANQAYFRVIYTGAITAARTITYTRPAAPAAGISTQYYEKTIKNAAGTGFALTIADGGATTVAIADGQSQVCGFSNSGVIPVGPAFT